MLYIIYQLKDIRNTDYAFREWEEAKSKYTIDDYYAVYSGDLGDVSIDKANEILEELFATFNINRPLDFYGHSLSASDVVDLITDDELRRYYCDYIGWAEVKGR